MAGKGGVGIELDLDAVPQRETGMTAYEMMLSESQERMLIVLRPGAEALARAIFDKWDLDFAVIGHITDTGRIVIRHRGALEADIPLQPLSDEAPLYRRPIRWPVPPAPLDHEAIQSPMPVDRALLQLIASPDLCSRAWIWNQYDAVVGGQTVKRPGGRGRRYRPDRGLQAGAGADHGLHAALLSGRPEDGRLPGGGRGLA